MATLRPFVPSRQFGPPGGGSDLERLETVPCFLHRWMAVERERPPRTVHRLVLGGQSQRDERLSLLDHSHVEVLATCPGGRMPAQSHADRVDHLSAAETGDDLVPRNALPAPLQVREIAQLRMHAGAWSVRRHFPLWQAGRRESPPPAQTICEAGTCPSPAVSVPCQRSLPWTMPRSPTPTTPCSIQPKNRFIHVPSKSFPCAGASNDHDARLE